MNDTSLTPRRFNQSAATRAAEAARLRIAGLPWDRVAELTGYSDRANCSRAVKAFYAGLPEPDRQTARAILRDRAEVVWRQIQVDMEEGRPGATRSATALLQRLAQLDGLDEPTRVTVAPSAEDFERAVQLLLPVARDGFADEAVEGDVFEIEA